MASGHSTFQPPRSDRHAYLGSHKRITTFWFPVKTSSNIILTYQFQQFSVILLNNQVCIFSDPPSPDVSILQIIFAGEVHAARTFPLFPWGRSHSEVEQTSGREICGSSSITLFIQNFVVVVLNSCCKARPVFVFSVDFSHLYNVEPIFKLRMKNMRCCKLFVKSQIWQERIVSEFQQGENSKTNLFFSKFRFLNSKTAYYRIR